MLPRLAAAEWTIAPVRSRLCPVATAVLEQHRTVATGVVLHDEDRVGRAGWLPSGGEHRIDAMRGEDIAGDRACQEPWNELICMGRLMVGATIQENRDKAVGERGKCQRGPGRSRAAALPKAGCRSQNPSSI